jgi:hypothetical protein
MSFCLFGMVKQRRNLVAKIKLLHHIKFYRSSVLTLIFRLSANRTVPKYQNRYLSRTLRFLFSDRFHQIKVFNVKITKNGSYFGTVRFALGRIISVKTEER